jgi:hypothetical protein
VSLVRRLAVHLGLVVHERFIKGADYSGPAIYIVPLAFAAVLVPPLVLAMYQPWRE